jgi:acetyltransferase-like isoleucine patch superfamily enzyme
MGFFSDAWNLVSRKRVFLFLHRHVLVDRSVVLSHPEKIGLALGVKINSYSVLKPGEGFIKIGQKTVVGEHCVFYGNNGLEIGERCIIAPQASIMAGGHNLVNGGKLFFEHPKKDRGIKLGRNVWIGANATILSGVTIGDNSVVAAGSVVTRDVPANTLVMGSPAKEAKRLE